jgi:ABC-type transport system involved in multi-copper enzyme maturation permease subunit
LQWPALKAIAAIGIAVNLRRLTTWVFAGVFVLIAYLLYRGPLRFGGMTASGAKLGTNSEFAIAAMLAAFSFFLMHFTATLTGDPVVKDARLGVGPLVRATPVERRTYLLGKFLGGYASLLVLYAIYVAALVLGQLVPPAEGKLTLAPRLAPYLELGFLFVLVPTFFVGATSFAIGTLTGSMKAVYIAVTALLVGWFLIVGSLPDDQLRWLAYIEPSGQAWLSEKVARGRGNAWLNENPIDPDLGLWLNRAALVAIGIAALAWTVVAWRPADTDSEVGGEVQPGRVRRWLRWASGRPQAVADRYTDWSGRTAVPRVEPAGATLSTWLAQLRGCLATELRLIAAERSLWIMVPIVMLLAGVDSVSHVGPFQVRVYPVSSEFAQQMVPALLILLAGTTIFYTGEVFHRDDTSGLRGILYATPASNSTLLLAKLGAMVLLSACMVGMTVLTALVSQAVQWYRIDGRWYLDLVPYGPVLLRVVLPSILFLSTLALGVNVLTRNRYVAYFVCILIAGVYVWALTEGHRSLLYNPLLVGHWAYSDLVGLGPFEQRLDWHHRYWAPLLVALFALSCWWMQRTQGSWRQFVSIESLRARPWGPLVALACTALAVLAGREIQTRGTLRGTRAELERDALALEDRWLREVSAPRLSYERIDLQVDLWPEQRRVDVRGSLALVNAGREPVARAVFTIDPLHEVRRLDLEGARGAPERDGPLWIVPLEQPVPAGGKTRLELDWSCELGRGWPQDGGPPQAILERGATFLSSLRGELVPLPGVDVSVFLEDRQRREDHGRAPLEPFAEPAADAYVPAAFGGDRPFELELTIRTSAGQAVLGTGELVEQAREGERERFVYRAEHPVRAFAVLAGQLALAPSDAGEVWHHPGHGFNLDTIRAALDDGRELFGERFGAYPHRSLRIVEFPRPASFAQSYPTLMPYSEAIGFLTNCKQSPLRVDATYFVTAHEVAHQWWGYLVTPGLAPGAQVLSESLAEYSAMVLIDEKRGERDRLVFLKQEEDAYLRGRDPDAERPLAELQLEAPPIWYHKGALTLYMLERQIGRDRLLRGLERFVGRWRDLDEPDAGPQSTSAAASRGHPTVGDLLDELRAAHAGDALDWFYETWFDAVVVPDMALDSEPVLQEAAGTWSVEFTATNLGQGRLPVQVEAVRGEWRPDRPGALEPESFEHGQPLRLWLEPGRSTRGVVSARFRPTALVIDRQYECIDFDRTNNARELGAPRSISAAPSSNAPTRR